MGEAVSVAEEAHSVMARVHPLANVTAGTRETSFLNSSVPKNILVFPSKLNMNWAGFWVSGCRLCRFRTVPVSPHRLRESSVQVTPDVLVAFGLFSVPWGLPSVTRMCLGVSLLPSTLPGTR